jgi:flagellar FliL protein
VEFDPDFTVNLSDGDNTRFLQIALAALTYYDDTEEALKNHMPQLRSSLITLFGSQAGDDLSTLEGKEQLRAAALAEITRVLESIGEDDVRIGQIFFTKFIVQ